MAHTQKELLLSSICTNLLQVFVPNNVLILRLHRALLPSFGLSADNIMKLVDTFLISSSSTCGRCYNDYNTTIGKGDSTRRERSAKAILVKMT